jgi:hypothetical protein
LHTGICATFPVDVEARKADVAEIDRPPHDTELGPSQEDE